MSDVYIYESDFGGRHLARWHGPITHQRRGDDQVLCLRRDKESGKLELRAVYPGLNLRDAVNVRYRDSELNTGDVFVSGDEVHRIPPIKLMDTKVRNAQQRDEALHEANIVRIRMESQLTPAEYDWSRGEFVPCRVNNALAPGDEVAVRRVDGVGFAVGLQHLDEEFGPLHSSYVVAKVIGQDETMPRLGEIASVHGSMAEAKLEAMHLTNERLGWELGRANGGAGEGEQPTRVFRHSARPQRDWKHVGDFLRVDSPENLAAQMRRQVGRSFSYGDFVIARDGKVFQADHASDYLVPSSTALSLDVKAHAARRDLNPAQEQAARLER